MYKDRIIVEMQIKFFSLLNADLLEQFLYDECLPQRATKFNFIHLHTMILQLPF